MWALSSVQVARLTALSRQRDLQRIGDALAGAFPDAHAKLGPRWNGFVEHGASRAAAYGLEHVLCVARFLASGIACGAEFETREAWAAAILTDDKRAQGAKAFQLCVRVLEQLRGIPHGGPAQADAFAPALRRLDEQLAGAGALASLLPRERIRLGTLCDIDAIELRLIDTQWRKHYTALGGPWRREACPPQMASIALVHEPTADAAPQWPERVTLLSHAAPADDVAKLRVRIRAQHRCDELIHPLLHHLDPAGARSLRGAMAEDATLSVHAEPVDASRALPHIGEEDSARFSVLEVASCGLRASGVPVGERSTLLAAYDATQHLIAWRHEPTAPWQLPADAGPVIAPARCRREFDGTLADSSSWQQGFQDLDAQLQRSMGRLLTAWERESGVSDGKLTVDAGVLVGSAGITWGWAEGPQGIAAPPYMRLEGLFDLIACRLHLQFTGVLARDGSRSILTLATEGSVPLAGPWQRGAEQPALFAAAAQAQVAVRQPFRLTVQPFADAGLAVAASSGALKGAISGTVGLEQRPDGPGLRWFARLNVEPVVAQLRIGDPLLGVQSIQQPLLPAHVLVDWSLA